MPYKEIISQWEELSTQVVQTKEKYDELIGKPQAIADKVQELLEKIKILRQGLPNRVQNLKSDLEKMVVEFEQMPQQIQQAIANFQNPAMQACDALYEQGQATLEQSGKKVAQNMTHLADVSENLLESQAEFVKDEILDPLEEKFDETLSDISEYSQEKREELETIFNDMSEAEIEFGKSLAEALDQRVEEWKEKVEDIVESYTDIGGRIENLGKTAEVLTNDVGEALTSTSVGMSLATSCIDDVKTIMSEIV